LRYLLITVIGGVGLIAGGLLMGTFLTMRAYHEGVCFGVLISDVHNEMTDRAFTELTRYLRESGYNCTVTRGPAGVTAAPAATEAPAR